MVLIGGLTRLTESGLSIVEWKLVSGILPPMGEQAWEQEFTAYKATPEFQLVNKHFSLSDFKRIFWLEYLHRLLGRVTGLVLLLPFIYFAARKQLSPLLTKRMAVACLLVAAQGAVGWIMVQSGLVDTPRVNPVKLALHLSLAFALFGLLLWTRWGITTPRPAATGFSSATKTLFALLCLQIIFGALVAGTDAGYSYNSFPLMDGKFIPTQLYVLEPWWRNHVEHILTVQFQHRMLAYAVTLLVIGLAFKAWKAATPAQRHALNALSLAVVLQFVLGMATLLSVMNMALASLHQLGALLLFGMGLRALYLYPGKSA